MRVKLLRMQYAGAEWIRSNLDAKRALSPFGESVADALGYVYRGIYHLRESALQRADWASDRWITIAVHGELASWDYDELTRLLVVTHDLGMRVAIQPGGPRRLRLCFSPREGAYVFGSPDRCAMTQLPVLQHHVAQLRAGYEVIDGPETRELEAS